MKVKFTAKVISFSLELSLKKLGVVVKLVSRQTLATIHAQDFSIRKTTVRASQKQKRISNVVWLCNFPV